MEVLKKFLKKCFWHFTFSTFMLSIAVGANAQPNNKDEAPKEFEAFIGNALGPAFLVKIDDQKRLAYYAPQSGLQMDQAEPVFVTPTPEQWAAFYATLDEYQIWEWEESYAPEQAVPDSTSWRIKLVWNDVSLDSSGYGATPEKGYGAFSDAVSKLVGLAFY